MCGGDGGWNWPAIAHKEDRMPKEPLVAKNELKRSPEDPEKNDSGGLTWGAGAGWWRTQISIRK